MDADILSRARSRAEFVASRRPEIMLTMESGAVAGLAGCAAALVGLCSPYGCFCDVSNGNPMMGGNHSAECDAATAAIRRLAGAED